MGSFWKVAARRPAFKSIKSLKSKLVDFVHAIFASALHTHPKDCHR